MSESKKEGPLRAAMTVVLMANEVVVARIDDPVLWNEVFAAINGGQPRLVSASPLAQTPPTLPSADPVAAAVVANTPAIDPLSKFAKELGVDTAVLAGACDPTSSEPYLELDLHHWEKMRKDLPSRGIKAIPNIVVVSTFLCLWARHSSLGVVTQALAQSVLDKINARDANPGRGLAGSDWLQQRQGGQIVLNPAKVSKALVVASAFCTQDWSGWKAL